MDEHPVPNGTQLNLFEGDEERALLDELLEKSRLYKTSSDYMNLLDFVVRMPQFAPFNAMLLQIQKPGLMFAATPRDWWVRCKRFPIVGARPLLILWPFAPVILVYDEQDTEGDPLPEGVETFFARGPIDKKRIASFKKRLTNKQIVWRWIDAGAGSAGSIRVTERTYGEHPSVKYLMCINKNHIPAVQFVTLVHELGHLFLGHLGADKKLSIPDRRDLSYQQRELEAESVSYIICKRHGVKSKAEAYLAAFVEAHTTIESLGIYHVMRAAGQVESILDLAVHTVPGKRMRKRRQ